MITFPRSAPPWSQCPTSRWVNTLLGRHVPGAAVALVAPPKSAPPAYLTTTRSQGPNAPLGRNARAAVAPLPYLRSALLANQTTTSRWPNADGKLAPRAVVVARAYPSRGLPASPTTTSRHPDLSIGKRAREDVVQAGEDVQAGEREDEVGVAGSNR